MSFEELVEKIVEKDPRFHPDAYDFLREALDFTQREVARGATETERHVTGGELIEGIRQFALQQFGPMAATVLNAWGITRCEDFGEIVFNLIDQQILRKRDSDSRDHFKGGYDFDDAFVRPFLPASRLRELDQAAAAARSGA